MAHSVRLSLELLNLTNPSAGNDQIGNVLDGALLRDYAFECRAVGTGTTATGRVETSFDDGQTWVTWFTFAAITGAGAVAQSPVLSVAAAPLLMHPGGLIRGAVDIVGAGYTSVRIKMSANPLR